MARERRLGNAEHRVLGRIRIGDETAVDHVGGASDLGERAGDEAAGAGFRGRDLEPAGAAALQQALQTVLRHFAPHARHRREDLERSGGDDLSGGVGALHVEHHELH